MDALTILKENYEAAYSDYASEDASSSLWDYLYDKVAILEDLLKQCNQEDFIQEIWRKYPV